MAGFVKLLVISKNKRTLTYPVYQNFVCENMSAVVSITAGGASKFLYGGTGKRVIPDIIQVEQTVSQIKALCNRCCDSTSV